MRKNNYIVILIILSIISCKSIKGDKAQNLAGKELIKQLAYCKCIEYCLSDSNKKDRIDYSVNWIIGMLLDHFGRYYSYKIEPAIDSLAKMEYLQIEKSKKSDKPVAIQSYGKAAYSLDCLNFYKSYKLDSIAEKLDNEFDISKTW